MEVFKILGRIALEGADEAGSELDNLKGKASKLGSGLKVVGKAFAGLTTAVGGIAVAVGAASVKVGAAFDSQMSTVQSISGATAEEFEMLRAKAQEMGATTSFSATESAQAFEYMAMAGWDAQQMSDGLAGVMNLAAASGEDLASASDIVTDAMTAFGMQAEESTYFSDVLAQTASSANTNVSMMGETFKYVAPLAGAMGYSIEDMSVAIGLMANSGIKGSQSGTSLRNIITNLASPSKEVAQAMKDLGISLTDNDGNVKTFGETLGDLRESFADLDEVERTLYASSIAGKEGMSGFLALVNSSDEDFEKLTKQIENCDGAAQKMADVRMDNLSGDVTLFKSALEGAGIAISDQLSPVLRDFVQNATAMIPKAQDSIAKFGGKIAEIGSKLLPVLIDTAEKLMPVISEVLDVISDMLDDLLPSFMDMLDIIVPILTEIVTDIAPFISQLLKSAMDFLKPICTNLLPPLAQLLEAVLNILTPVLKVLSPIVTLLIDITTGVFGVLIDGLSRLLGFNALEKTAEQFSRLSDEEQAAVDKTTELIEEQEKLHTTLQNGFSRIDDTYLKYDNLIGKLDTMVDSNGKVKEGYEKQVDFIVNELNDAFGTEIAVIDGKIQKYQEEKQAIEDVMVVKKAEAYLNSAEDEYTEALRNQTEYQQNYAKAVNAINDELSIKQDLEKQIADMEKFANENQGTIDLKVYDELHRQLEGTNNRLKELENNKRKASIAMSDNDAIISNFDKMTDAIANGDIPAMNEAMEDMANNFIDASTGTEEALALQTIEFAKNLSEMKQAAEIEGSKITQAQVENSEIMYQKSLEEWSKLSGMSAEELEKTLGTVGSFTPLFRNKSEKLGQECASGLESQQGNVKTSCEALSDAGIEGVSSGDYYGTGESKGSDFADGFMSKINECLSKGQSAIDAFINSNEYNSGNVALADYVSAVKTKIPPKTATGGIVTRAQTRIVGEDGAEAIVPLEKNTEWIDKVASRINGGTSNNAVLEKLTELNENIKNLKVYLDSGTLVGEIAPKMDKKLGSIAKRKMRGAVV